MMYIAGSAALVTSKEIHMEITHHESSRTLLGQEDPRNSNMVSVIGASKQ
jgi:hypothetical protein